MSEQKPNRAKQDEDLVDNLEKQIIGFLGKIINKDYMDTQNNSPTAENLTRMLLGDLFNLPHSYEEDDEKKKESYAQFYTKFITYIIKEYTKNNLDANILLVKNRLLPGYEEKSCAKRCKHFVKEHAKNDNRLRSDWPNPYQNITKTYEPKILDHMIPLLVTQIIKYKSARLFDAAEKIASELDLDIKKRNSSNEQTQSVIKPPTPFRGELVPPTIGPILPTIEPKTSIKSRIVKAVVITSSVLIFIALTLYIFTTHTRKSEQIEPGQVQHEGVTYSEIQQEDVSSEDVPLDKPIFEEVFVCDDEENEVKRIRIFEGESIVLSAHFSPNDAPKSKLCIDSEDTSILNIRRLDTGIPNKLPFVVKTEMGKDVGNFPIAILVEGPGAIPACVNVYIDPNNFAHYSNKDIQNSKVSKNGGMDNEE